MWLIKKILVLAGLILGVVLLLSGLSFLLISLVSIVEGTYLPGGIEAVLGICMLWGGWRLVVRTFKRLFSLGEHTSRGVVTDQVASAATMAPHNPRGNLGSPLSARTEGMTVYESGATVETQSETRTKESSWPWSGLIILLAVFILICVSIIMAGRFFGEWFYLVFAVVISVAMWFLRRNESLYANSSAGHLADGDYPEGKEGRGYGEHLKGESEVTVEKHHVPHEATLGQLIQQQVGDFVLVRVDEPDDPVTAYYQGIDGRYVSVILMIDSSPEMAFQTVQEMTRSYVHEEGSHQVVYDFRVVSEEHRETLGQGVVLEEYDNGENEIVMWRNHRLIALVQGPPELATAFFLSSKH